MGRKNKILVQLFIIGLIVLIGSWIPLPYFYQMPGSAIELRPIVSVEDGDPDDTGSFFMTTVSLNRTNIWEYLYASIHPGMDLLKVEQVKAKNETDEEYFNRQRDNMVFSQQKAIKVAFERAGEPIEVHEEGAVVYYFVEGMSAEKVLRSGDIVIEVDGTPIHNSDELILAFTGKKAGEIAKVVVLRKAQRMEVELEIMPFPQQYQTNANETRVGAGILSPQTKLLIEPSRKVQFNTEKIGGPSAGLMFTLELINQLKDEDITKGKRISGTGTIELDGSVGPIGGAKHKVVAAYREGAEIFFAPDDGTSTSNYQEALQAVKEKGLDIIVVPVRTIDDALEYLRNL